MAVDILVMVSTISPITAAFRSPGCTDSLANAASISALVRNTISPPSASEREIFISDLAKSKKKVEARVMGGQNPMLPGSQKAFLSLDLPWALGSSRRKYSSLSCLWASDSLCCKTREVAWTTEISGLVTPVNLASKNLVMRSCMTVVSSPSIMAMLEASNPAASATCIKRATTMPALSESFIAEPMTSLSMKCLPTLMTLIQ
mmetsp:Transcript_14476/g.39910  ORF Transcript_14476/g.39910 Transcript_14476/m.39910 type:complete len:203 (-) Transcript_14476:179-787(-)